MIELNDEYKLIGYCPIDNNGNVYIEHASSREGDIIDEVRDLNMLPVDELKPFKVVELYIKTT